VFLVSCRGIPDKLHFRLPRSDSVEQVIRNVHLRFRLPRSHVAHHFLLLQDRGTRGESRKSPQGTGGWFRGVFLLSPESITN